MTNSQRMNAEENWINFKVLGIKERIERILRWSEEFFRLDNNFMVMCKGEIIPDNVRSKMSNYVLQEMMRLRKEIKAEKLGMISDYTILKNKVNSIKKNIKWSIDKPAELLLYDTFADIYSSDDQVPCSLTLLLRCQVNAYREVQSKKRTRKVERFLEAFRKEVDDVNKFLKLKMDYVVKMCTIITSRDGDINKKMIKILKDYGLKDVTPKIYDEIDMVDEIMSNAEFYEDTKSWPNF